MDCSTDFYSQLSGLPKEQQHKECTNFLRNSSSDDKVLLNRALSFKCYVDYDLHTEEGFKAGDEGFKQWCMKHQGTLFGKNPHEEGKSLNREPERMLAVSDVLVAVHNDSTIIIKPTSIGQLSAIYSRGAYACWLDVVVLGFDSFMGQGFTSADEIWGQLQLRTIAKADKLFRENATLFKWDSKLGRLINHPSRKLNVHHFTNAAHIVKLEIELEAGLAVSLLGAGVVGCIC
jgi:hypothetical protein